MRKHLATYTFVLAAALILFTFKSCTPVRMDYPSFGVFMNSVSKDTRNKINKFRDEYASSLEKETFIFFSDPHIFPQANSDTTDSERAFNAKFSEMKNIAHYLDINFTICGGDWITKGDYQEFAKRKLLFAKHYMDKWFEPYYPIMGNHDTNVMGVMSENDSSAGLIPMEFLENGLFSNLGHTYYTFKGEKTRFYVLDTYLDWRFTEHMNSQIHWLAESLLSNADPHIAIAQHIYTDGGDITKMTDAVMKICVAFNEKKSITYDKVTYDFSPTVGKIHFALVGHNHKDYVNEEYGIPVICTQNFLKTGTASYDLCIVNYDSSVLRMFRIGDGQSRDIPI